MKYHNNTRLHKIIRTLTVTLLLQTAYAEEKRGISTLRTELNTLELQLNALKVKSDKESTAAVARRLDLLFKSAEQAFAEQEYLTTIRLFNEVLSRSSQLEVEPYLKAQYLLARSYEELNVKPKATKAYIRYISSFTSQKSENYKQLIEVIRRSLLLQEKASSDTREDLYRLLANLMSLPLPNRVQIEVTLLSSIAAYHAERYEIAIPWLNSLDLVEVPSKIRAEAGFYAALNWIAINEDEKAEKALLKVMTIADPATGITQDLAALNLARVYASKNMPQHAWEWYQRVNGPGLSLRLAAYEAVLLLMQNQEFEKSLKIAQAYIKHYPNTPEAFRLKEWINYLEMRSGRLDSVESKLQSRDKSLVELQGELLGEYAGKSSINQHDLVKIQTKTEVMALQSPVMEESQKLFQHLDAIDSSILNIGQQIRSLVFTLGRVIDPKLRPEVQSANQQFKTTMAQLFSLGEELLTEERNLYKDKITASQEKSLKRSKARREKIYALDQRANGRQWKLWDQLFQVQIKASANVQRLEKQRLVLQNIILLGQKPQASSQDIERSQQAARLLDENKKIQEKLASTMESIHLQILDLSKSPSELRNRRRTLLLAAQEFIDSATLLESLRDTANHPLQKQEQLEYAKAWTSWQTIAGKILLAIKQDEDSQKDWLEQQMKEIRSIKEQQLRLTSLGKDLREKLQITTARALPSVLDHFQYHIRQQQSRTNKWLADLQWQRFVLQSEERSKIEAKYDEEETEIKENLKDLEIERTIHE